MIKKEDKKHMRKIMFGLALLFGIALALIPLVRADSYELYCLGPGEQVDLGALCNPAMESRTGPANLCMHLLDNGKICPANLNTCNSLGLSCTTGGSTGFDEQPPALDIFSPVEGEIYAGRSILLEFDVNEIADVYYRGVNDNGRWKTGCNGCSFYSRERSFEEGFNELVFKAIDRAGNTAYFNRSFYLDSKEPKIKSVEPRKGFASGEFYVEFDEDSPGTLVLTYGNNAVGWHDHAFNIGDCVEDRNYECTTNVDLGAYDGQMIGFYVTLTDIAGNADVSKMEDIAVDYSPPVIDFFDFMVDGKKVYFNVEITEANFDRILYLDNSDSRARWKKLCSRLVNGVCEKSVSFKDGAHDVDVVVYDKAGNFAERNAQFFTDSKKPKIKSTEPRKGFASGEFYVKFNEANPGTLVLTYGNNENHILDISNDCVMGNRDYECVADVDLSAYDGQEIEYSFALSDTVGQTDEDGGDGLKVDITSPVINSIDPVINGNRADVLLDVTELNFDEATYINHNDRRPRERRFCSRLDDDGTCDKRIKLNEGMNSIDIIVFDGAGNVVGQNFEIVSP